MMSQYQIEQESRAAARRSARLHQQPFVFWDGDSLTDCPFIGDRCPRGWRRLKWTEVPNIDPNARGHYGNVYVVLFVDSWGGPDDGEPALPLDKANRDAEAISHNAAICGNLTVGWAIIEAGQFQVNIGAFVKREPRS